MEDVHSVAPSLHLNPLADEPERHGIPARRQTDQVVFGHGPRDPRLLLEATLTRQWNEKLAFSLKSRDRSLMSRAVQTLIGDRGGPFVELGLKVHHINECPTREEFRFTYFTPDSTLPLVWAR